MTVHGVHGEQPAAKRQGFDHLLGGGDFVALFRHLQMAQDQRIFNRKCAQNMRRPLVVESIKTVPERLTVLSPGTVALSTLQSEPNISCSVFSD